MLTGKATFKAKLKQAVPTIERKINAVHREVVRRIFTDLVMNSPQWSGNLASNWYIGSGSYQPIPGYSQEDWYREDPYKMGDADAASAAFDRHMSKILKLSYKNPVKIGNSTPYASEVEGNTGPNGRPIREVNKLAAYGKVAMIGYAAMKYNQLKPNFQSWGRTYPTIETHSATP